MSSRVSWFRFMDHGKTGWADGMTDVLAGPAPPGETPHVSPRQLAAAQQASAKQQTSATARSMEASASGHPLLAEVPMICQIAPESSSPSLQPSTSEASIIRYVHHCWLPLEDV